MAFKEEQEEEQEVRTPLLLWQSESELSQNQSQNQTQTQTKSHKRHVIFPLSVCLIAFILTPILILTIPITITNSRSFSFNNINNNNNNEICPQYEFPSSSSSSSSSYKLNGNTKSFNTSRLVEAITYKTISYDFMRDVPPPPISQPDDQHHLEFTRFHAFLDRAFPLVKNHLERVVINR
jgi:hypothetical protein